jgi:hypothetical protein
LFSRPQQQCEKYAPEAFSTYETLMRNRHSLPEIADSMAGLSLDIGASVFNSMEVRV